MSDDTLATDLIVNAYTRLAAKEGVPITVIRRGYNSSGTIIVKINRLDGTADVLTQVRFDNERVWVPVKKQGPMTEAEAAAVEQSIRRDRPFGSDTWTRTTAERLGLESSLRSRGGQPRVAKALAKTPSPRS